MTGEKFMLTTAIAYTSSKPHVGNCYETVLADAICRWRRAKGEDVYFQTGTDEHGIKIETKAAERGLAPKEHVDEIAGQLKGIYDLLGTSYDRFVRTTDPAHELRVQHIFKKLYEKGDIYKGRYEGWYCVPCEAFYTESQLKVGVCPECGSKVSYQEEEAYFFALSKYQERLEGFLEENPDFIQPQSRKNEMVNNFIKPGLKDLCVSRTTFTWGIPVDFDEGHVVYVWIDALSNYITFLGYDPYEAPSEEFSRYWPADVHLIGKDILRFHTIIWPCILMALDVPLPKSVFGHPWLLVGEEKMSKSIGNVIYADDLVDAFGLDPVRYYLLKEMPYAQDGTFTYKLLIERVNTELANVIGNLVNRTLSMTVQNFGGIVPEPSPAIDTDSELADAANALFGAMDEAMARLDVSAAMNLLLGFFRRCNKYVDETTPWVLAKDPDQRERLGAVLYNLLECIRVGFALLSPFLPSTGAKVLSILGAGPVDFTSLQFGQLASGGQIGAFEPLFARINEAEKLEEIRVALEKKA